MTPPRRILPIIVIAQFFCTSLWFAGNAVIGDLVIQFQLASTALGHLTSAIQVGFITGTLTFAFLTIADRFSPSKVFMLSAVAGALSNLGILLDSNTMFSLLFLRFATGFFLAGIYPIGMKIAADYYDKGLGKSLGFLVGALVLGTAFPHLLKGISASFLPWKVIILGTSVLAILGGLMMYLGVPDGPNRKASQQLDLSAFLSVFRSAPFRSAAFGYFGHMWELYAFWAFVPFVLKSYSIAHPEIIMSIPLLSFLIIGIGSLACVVSGYLSISWGTKQTAFMALTLSFVCCIVSPFAFEFNTLSLFVGFLLFWGMVVIADSPLFSTLIAQNAPLALKGTALTIVNCVGFAITIVSIQLLTYLQTTVSSKYLLMILAIGPAFGLLALMRKN